MLSSGVHRSLPSIRAFLTFGLLLFSGAIARAQTAGPFLSPADCTNAGLETTLHVYRAPEHVQVIALDYRNTNATACLLRPDGGPAQGEVLTLKPGATAHTSFRWSTEPSKPEVSCHDQNFRTIAVNRSPNGLLLSSPTLLPRICSEVRYDAYADGPFVPDWPAALSTAKPRTPLLRLTTAKASFYQNERVNLHLAMEHLDTELPVSKYECPILFRTLRNTSGFTQIDEITPVRGLPCKKPKTQEGPPPDNAIYDIDARQGSSFEQVGEKTFQLSQFTGYSAEGELLLAGSNAVAIRFEDPATISRTWGRTEKGVRVDLTLDKLTYRVGEDIPLHIAAEVVSAEQPVYGEIYASRGVFFNNFAGAFKLTISDEDGPLPRNEDDGLSDLMSGSSGPSACPGSLPAGKIFSLERSAEHYHLLPTRPGTYKMVLSWSPYRTKYTSCDEVPGYDSGVAPEKPFVTVTSAPLTIRVTGKVVSSDGVPEEPEYTAWKQGFTLTDTSFGEQTALLDKATRLEWLRVSLSGDIPEGKLQPSGSFDGWRFATAEEVRIFFAHFTGTPDGHSKDPSIERKLQRLLGGPLDIAKNEQTGWSRRAVYARIAGLTPATREQSPLQPASFTGGFGFIYYFAYIAEDTQNGQIDATVDPDQRGWVISDVQGPNRGTFFVRQR